jgi:hypothetical protein
MNWDAIRAAAEVLAAGGVIISLIYLGTQVKNSARSARHAAAQSIFTKINTLHEALACNPSTANVWARGSTGLASLPDPADRVQFSALMMAHIRLYEELYYCREQGDVDDWAWASVTAQLNDVAATRGVGEWWAARKHWCSPEFAAFVGRSLPEAPRNVIDDFSVTVVEDSKD